MSVYLPAYLLNVLRALATLDLFSSRFLGMVIKACQFYCSMTLIYEQYIFNH